MSNKALMFDLYRSLLHGLKGIESGALNLNSHVLSAKHDSCCYYGTKGLLARFRELFVMRCLINIAVERLAGGSNDELILLLVSSIQKWLIIIDSSIDSLIASDYEEYRIAKLIYSTAMQASLIRTLFLIIANDSMIRAYERGTLRDFDRLSINIYYSEEYWLRFPTDYDLVQHIGRLFQISYDSCYHIFSLPKLQLFPDETDLAGRMSVEFARLVMLYNIFQQVSIFFSINKMDKKLSIKPMVDCVPNENDSGLQAVDAQLLWSTIFDESSNNHLLNMLESMETIYPIQRLYKDSIGKSPSKYLSTIFDRVMTLSNPLEFFQAEIIYAAYKLSSGSEKSPALRSLHIKSKIAELTQQYTSTTQIRVQSMPATLPMPRSLKPKDDIAKDDQLLQVKEAQAKESIEKAFIASSKERKEETSAAAADEAVAAGDVIATLPLGAEKVVDPIVGNQAKEYLKEKYSKLQLEMEIRKARAVWQIRRLKRLRSAKKQLSSLYADPRSDHYLHLVVDPPSASTAKNVTYDSEVNFPSSNNTVVSRKKESASKPKQNKSLGQNLVVKDSASKTAEKDTKESETITSAVQRKHKKSIKTIDSSVSSETKSVDHETFKIGANSKTINETIDVKDENTTISTKVQTNSSSESKNVATESNDDIFPALKPILPYQPLIQLESSLSKDNLVPDTPSRIPAELVISGLHSSLRNLGLDEALTAEKFLQELCGSFPVSLLLTALSCELIDIAPAVPHDNTKSVLYKLLESKGSVSMEKTLLHLISSRLIPRYQGFVSYFQAMSQAVHIVEVENFRNIHFLAARQLILKHDLMKYILGAQEFFLMSPSRCSSFLFDTCVFLVEQAWRRITDVPSFGRKSPSKRFGQLPQHQQEDLWSNLAFTEALRDSSTRLHSDWQPLFRSARYYFQQKGADTFDDRYFKALSETHPLWPLVANHRLGSLVIDFQVPPCMQMFFNRDIMMSLSSFTRRYLEIGQLMAVYRIISVETRRSVRLSSLGKEHVRLVHAQVFEMLHVLQSFLRYFNDRHMTITRVYLQSLQDGVIDGLHRLLQRTIIYAKEVAHASFCIKPAEQALKTSDFADHSLISAVMLRICVNNILQEVRLFGLYLLSYLHSNGGGDDNDSTEDSSNIMQKLTDCGKNIRDLRRHIVYLSDNIIEVELKDHANCLKYYISF